MIKTSDELPIDTILNSAKYPRLLTAFYQAAVRNAFPVALWRYPFDDEPQAVVDLSGQSQTTKIDFHRPDAGFAFAPFMNMAGQATRFIRASLHLNRAAGRQGIAGQIAGQNPHFNTFLSDFARLIEDIYPSDWGWHTMSPGARQPHVATEAEYRHLVERAIQTICTTPVEKIVTSRATQVPLPASFSPMTVFRRLCRRYPHAFVSLVSIPEVGTWIGATPETLLSLDSETIYTVALAGTQALSAQVSLDEVEWRAKEIEEYALVSDYIRHFLHQFDWVSYQESRPRTVSAGNLAHLRSDFYIRPRHIDYLPRLGNLILEHLHPTSAVCGMPRADALRFILENEGYDRAFYSGFLGPVHIRGQSQLFVNLRCMQLAADNAILYVGGGITRDSIPAQEWQETVWKTKTLLPVLDLGTDAPASAKEPAFGLMTSQSVF